MLALAAAGLPSEDQVNLDVANVLGLRIFLPSDVMSAMVDKFEP